MPTGSCQIRTRLHGPRSAPNDCVLRSVPRLRCSCSTPPAHAPVTARDKRKRSWTGKASPCGVVWSSQPASEHGTVEAATTPVMRAWFLKNSLACSASLPLTKSPGVAGCGPGGQGMHARARPTTPSCKLQTTPPHLAPTFPYVPPAEAPRERARPPVQALRGCPSKRPRQGATRPAPSPASACSGSLLLAIELPRLAWLGCALV